MGWESSGVVGFDLWPLLQGQTRISKLKSVYISLIIGPRGFGALSLWWIQFASVLRCARSSYKYYFLHTFLPHYILSPSSRPLLSTIIYLSYQINFHKNVHTVWFTVVFALSVCIIVSTFLDRPPPSVVPSCFSLSIREKKPPIS